MSLQKIVEDYAAALEILRRLTKNVKWNDMVDAYIIDMDTVAAASILVQEIDDAD